jgi:hypothetical protein
VLGLQQLPLLAAWQEAWQGCTFRRCSSSSRSAELCRNLAQQQQHGHQTVEDHLQDDSATTAAAAAAAEDVRCLPAVQLPGSVPVLYGEWQPLTLLFTK